MILSYHLLLLWVFSPINWYLSCHRSLVCVVFGCLFRVLFVVLFLGVLPVFLDERDSDSARDYVSVLHQFTFAAATGMAFA